MLQGSGRIADEQGLGTVWDESIHGQVYQDQASLPEQLRLLQSGRLQFAGADGARSLFDRSIRLNGLVQCSKGRRGKL